MRIVAWNCQMALGKKRELLYQLRPDVAVISECSRDSMLACRADGFDTCWWGENKHKGLGVLAAKPWALDCASRPGPLSPQHKSPKQRSPGQRSPRQRWIAPIWVRGLRDFLLLSVWACPVGSEREKNYVGQTYEAIVRHPNWFAAGVPTLVCGDFNSNVIFDRGRKTRKHSTVVKLLAERGIVSAYHAFYSEGHGEETRPTYYFWRRKERGFHIDYIFVPHSWVVTNFKIGTYKKWITASDHVPILADIAEASHAQETNLDSVGDPAGCVNSPPTP